VDIAVLSVGHMGLLGKLLLKTLVLDVVFEDTFQLLIGIAVASRRQEVGVILSKPAVEGE
jgi:hypothetical protein